jgi:hypothetical protein
MPPNVVVAALALHGFLRGISAPWRISTISDLLAASLTGREIISKSAPPGTRSSIVERFGTR